MALSGRIGILSKGKDVVKFTRMILGPVKASPRSRFLESDDVLGQEMYWKANWLQDKYKIITFHKNKLYLKKTFCIWFCFYLCFCCFICFVVSMILEAVEF